MDTLQPAPVERTVITLTTQDALPDGTPGCTDQQSRILASGRNRLHVFCEAYQELRALIILERRAHTEISEGKESSLPYAYYRHKT